MQKAIDITSRRYTYKPVMDVKYTEKVMEVSYAYTDLDHKYNPTHDSVVSLPSNYSVCGCCIRSHIVCLSRCDERVQNRVIVWHISWEAHNK